MSKKKKDKLKEEKTVMCEGSVPLFEMGSRERYATNPALTAPERRRSKENL